MDARKKELRQVPTIPFGPSEAPGSALTTACPALSHLRAQRGSIGQAPWRKGAGLGASRAPAKSWLVPGAAPRLLHLPGEAAARPPRPAPSPPPPPPPRAARTAGCLRPRERAPAPPRRPRPEGPLPRGGRAPSPKARFQVWPPRENGSRSAAELPVPRVGTAPRREAHGGLPPPAAHAPGAVTSRGWGL